METGKSHFDDFAQRYGFYAALVYEMIGTAVVTWSYNLVYKSDEIRAVAYFVMYILAVNVSGGHFNPATSLAVYMTESESKSRNTRYLIAVIIFQIIGAYLGVVMAFILLKDYISGGTGFWADRFLESYSLYPRPMAFTS